MELSKMEISAVRETLKKNEEVLVDLNELELAMIGGGTGGVHFG